VAQNQTVIFVLVDVQQVLGIHEQADLAQDKFAHRVDLHIGAALDVVETVFQRLSAGIIGFNTNAPAPTLFPYGDESGTVVRSRTVRRPRPALYGLLSTYPIADAVELRVKM
jgi:hypothetical protein